MYLRYFGLEEKPFNITPNPRFVFLSRQHREVLAHLLYGLQSRCGFIEITGEVGAGKTTMLRTLFDQLAAEEFRLALIFNPSLSADELLVAICREYGLLAVADDRNNLLERLNRFLLDENAAGRTVVLVIDEAQNLTAPVLEQIRLLSNLETETDKLIQIVLVGQPELGSLLAQPNLRQLSQRIAVRYHLRPMDRQDSRAYIQHRLQIAGAGQAEQLFSSQALRAIYRASGGLPRLINVLCDRALLAAYSADSRSVDAAALRVAVTELERQPLNSARKWWRTLAVTVLVVASVSGLFIWRSLPTASRSVAAEPAMAKVSEPSFNPQRLTAYRQSLAALSEEQSFERAISALASACRAERSSFPASIHQFTRQPASGPWFWLAHHGDLDRTLGFESPLLLELRLPGVSGRRYLAVTRRKAGVFVTAPNPRELDLSLPELKALYSGRAWLPWQNYLGLGSITQTGQSGLDVSQLQTLLNQSGFYRGPVNGLYDTATIQAVTSFQAAVDIVQDGRVGPLTLMLLYRDCNQFHPPQLTTESGGHR